MISKTYETINESRGKQLNPKWAKGCEADSTSLMTRVGSENLIGWKVIPTLLILSMGMVGPFALLKRLLFRGQEASLFRKGSPARTAKQGLKSICRMLELFFRRVNSRGFWWMGLSPFHAPAPRPNTVGIQTIF